MGSVTIAPTDPTPRGGEWQPHALLHSRLAAARAVASRCVAIGLTGLAVGVVMAIYQLLLSDMIDLLWTTAALQLLTPAWAVLLVPPILLCLAALLMRELPHGHMPLFIRMVTAGEHVDVWRGLVGTVCVSILAIASGGSAGPEGPVLAIGAALSLAIHQVALRKRLHPQEVGAGQGKRGAESDTRPDEGPAMDGSVQTAALLGGCCALAATLDNPVTGCVMGMELPHLYGSVKRGSVFASALLASCVSFAAHRSMMQPFAIEGVPTLPPTACTLAHLPLALPIGLFAGALAYAFVRAKEVLEALPYSTVPRALVLGFIVGFIALVLPETLMWGEHRLGILASEYDETDGQALLALISPGYSASLGLAKLAATVLTIAAGYPGGFVYALVFVGYMLGPMSWQLAVQVLPALTALDDMTHVEFIGPPSPRGITAEITAQALGSALLAGVLRAPLGGALLIGGCGGASSLMYALLILANFVSMHVNPRSPARVPDD